MSLKRYAIVFVLAVLGLIVVGIALAPGCEVANRDKCLDAADVSSA